MTICTAPALNASHIAVVLYVFALLLSWLFSCLSGKSGGGMRILEPEQKPDTDCHAPPAGLFVPARICV
ncbi:MAG: hypothetical protein HFF17_00190 [Oscillospiraceae bacterium]|nr:hypothetical protein [Oscillospiraceae bacterium]